MAGFDKKELDNLYNRLIQFLNKNQQASKELYRYDRKNIIDFLSNCFIPRTYDNLVYIFNELEFHDKNIQEITPALIRKKCDDYINGTAKEDT